MSRVWYWVIGGIAVVLCVAGLIAFSEGKENQRAEQKAQELTQKLERVGRTAPDQDVIVRSLGDDGGAVCETADDEGLGRAILVDQLSNGGAHVGRRPIIADRRVVVGQLLIVETYCPDVLQEARETIEDLEFDDVIKD